MSFDGDLYPEAGATSVMTTKGDMVDFDAIRQRLAIGSANQILQVKSSLPSWETVPLADKVLTTAGDVLYENATPELARLPISSNGDVLTLAGGLPTWATPSAGGAYTLLASVVGDDSSGTITSGTITAMNSLTVYVWTEAFVNGRIRFNSDTGSNYSNRYRGNNNTSASVINQTGVEFLWDLAPAVIAINIMNNTAGEEKMFTALSSDIGSAGSGTAPNGMVVNGKWANTANRITEVEFNKSTNWLSTERIIVVGID